VISGPLAGRYDGGQDESHRSALTLRASYGRLKIHGRRCGWTDGPSSCGRSAAGALRIWTADHGERHDLWRRPIRPRPPGCAAVDARADAARARRRFESRTNPISPSRSSGCAGLGYTAGSGGQRPTPPTIRACPTPRTRVTLYDHCGRRGRARARRRKGASSRGAGDREGGSGGSVAFGTLASMAYRFGACSSPPARRGAIETGSDRPGSPPETNGKLLREPIGNPSRAELRLALAQAGRRQTGNGRAVNRAETWWRRPRRRGAPGDRRACSSRAYTAAGGARRPGAVRLRERHPAEALADFDQAVVLGSARPEIFHRVAGGGVCGRRSLRGGGRVDEALRRNPGHPPGAVGVARCSPRRTRAAAADTSSGPSSRGPRRPAVWRKHRR